MNPRRITLTLTTDSAGAATGYTKAFTGVIDRIVYDKTDFADGVDFTITTDLTGETVWAEENVNAAATRAPRQATHSTAGVAAVYAAAGEAVNDRMLVVADKLKVVIASGGDTKSGTFHFIIY